MRGYIPVTPIEIEEFSTAGFFRSPHAYAMTASFQRENVDEDHEELEFQLSFRAALESRRRLQLDAGYVVALDLEINQLGVERDDTIELVADLRWTQVESILVSDSEDEELTWFARQEVETQLADWLGAGKRDGAS